MQFLPHSSLIPLQDEFHPSRNSNGVASQIYEIMQKSAKILRTLEIIAAQGHWPWYQSKEPDVCHFLLSLPVVALDVSRTHS